MRLLYTKRMTIESFTEYQGGNALGDAVPEYAVPRYAILSHTWADEVSFQEMQAIGAALNEKKRGDIYYKYKEGHMKIRKSCKLARSDGFDWIWIDTCCIDKTNSTELSEAINSMFRWYRNAAVCYVYLSTASGTQPIYDRDVVPFSSNPPVPRWYSRGWTLQELIAPSDVRFYSRDWRFLGTKKGYATDIVRITGIDVYALDGGNLSRMSVARRMSWLGKRETTRPEDMAYCMLGIFGISMPMMYGEGRNAFVRLQEEIVKVIEDQSIFAWVEHDPDDYYREDYGDSFESTASLLILHGYSPSRLSSRDFHGIAHQGRFLCLPGKGSECTCSCAEM